MKELIGCNKYQSIHVHTFRKRLSFEDAFSVCIFNFHEGSPCYIERSHGFYMIGTAIMKELRKLNKTTWSLSDKLRKKLIKLDRQLFKNI